MLALAASACAGQGLPMAPEPAMEWGALRPAVLPLTWQTAPAPQPAAADSEAQSDGAEASTMFPHTDKGRYLILGQANIIFQAHARFHADYTGRNSMLPRGEYKTSMVGTLFLGYQLNARPRYATDLIYDEESAGGRGISEALGLAGFTNLDVVRNPNLGSTPYLARVEVHQVIGFTGTLVDSARTPFSLATKLPATRLELHVGKLGIPDFFDLNSVGTDSHLQFMNWTSDNNGAWDYAADTRGYTVGAVAEFISPVLSARYGYALLPTIANGIDLEYHLNKAHAQNVEVEMDRGLLGKLVSAERKGVVRLLGYVNDANMGDYRAQNVLWVQGKTATPDITAHPEQVTRKYGLGLNFEQEMTKALRVYGRWGWNEGQHESYAYTEVDDTYSVGADLRGDRWGRSNDKVGLTVVTNAIKRDHQWYLGHGGLGFILGDGRLNYAREDIVEAYYNWHAWKGVHYALDEQLVAHPGYNQDRGPVMVESVRMHVDF